MGLGLAKISCKPFKLQSHRVVKHIQTTFRLLLKICLSVYDLFVGLVLKVLRTSILTFFLANSILMHCYYVFSLDHCYFFIEIYVTLLFSNFKLIFCQYCVLFTSHWFYYTISRLPKSSH